MRDRNHTIEQFLGRHGYALAHRERLAGDASTRAYERLRGGPRPAVLMDAPPPDNDVRPFLRVATILRGRGLSAPEIIAAEPDLGLVLLEDLGDGSFSRLLAAGADAHPLYATAIDLLVALQREVPPDLPPYDDAWLIDEAMLLPQWYAPDLSAEARDAYRRIWREILPAARVGADTFVHVDYHADNLLWLPDRGGLARIGLLDFQDARIGPPAYDVVSLLEDARRDVDPALADAMVERYLAHRSDLDAEAFHAAYALLGAQRNAKILGIFSRLARRDGKERYLALQPRVAAHLRRDLEHPHLAPLRRWFDRHLKLGVAP